MRIVISLCFVVFLLSCEKQNPLEDILNEISSHRVLTDEEREEYPLGRYTEEDFKAQADFATKMVEKLKAIDASEMEFTDQISVELMIYRMQEDIDHYDFQAYLNPILVDAGFHIGFANRPNRYRFRSTEDYEKYIRDLKAFPKYVQQHIELMRKGLARGIAQPKAILDGYDVTYNTHLVADYTESSFYAPFLQFPDSFSEEDKTELLKKGKNAVENGA